MTDETSIYISAEDDVTSVRERLEKEPNRQVTLVIPAQTQLRSLVAWRVLHADVRRMGKDVLVVSIDPQIRSLAQAGKFRVAHSQASSITGKSRPATRPSRGAAKSKLTSSQARMQAAKKPSVQLPPDAEDEATLTRRTGSNAARTEKPLGSWYGPLPESSSPARDTEHPFEATTTGNLKRKNTPFNEPQPGQIYDIHADTTPTNLRQVPLDSQQEESATYWADDVDYKHAENIRKQYSESPATPLAFSGLPKTPRVTPHSDTQDDHVQGSSYRTTPLPQQPADVVEPDVDAYPLMDDHLPLSSLHEQRGSAIINGLDTGEHNLYESPHEEPGQVIESGIQVEDLGEDPGINMAMFDAPPIIDDTPHHSWSEPLEQEQQESAGPSRLYRPNGLRSSRHENREGGTSSSRRQDLDDDVDLPPIEERPTTIIAPEEFAPVVPRARPRNSAALDVPETPASNKKSTGKRASQQILTPAPRITTTMRPKTNVPARAATNAGSQRAKASVAGRGAPTKKLPEQSSRRSGAILLLLVILLLLLIGIPAFFLPTADITLKLPAKDYAHAIVLRAIASGQKNTATDTVPADSLTNDFEATGTGKATSSAKIGTAPATGTVTFTNNGKTHVTIPSGTIVTTSTGVSFSTQAEAVVDIASSSTGATIPIPVQAQKPGTTGNVGAGSINAVPPDALNAIAMANKMNGSDLKLTVTNEQATTGGGAGTTPAISQQDIDAAKATLHTTLNNQFKTWLATKIATGDQAGTLTTTETLENTPTAGQPATDGTFIAKLKLSVAVLIVRAASLQQGAIAQLNQYAKTDKAVAGYTVVDDAKHPVQVQRLKVTSDNKSMLTLAFTAAGKVVPNIDTQTVQSLANGKSIKDAKSILLQNLQGVRQVDISTAPHLGNWTPTWVPFWSAHIAVHLIPEDSVAPPKKK